VINTPEGNMATTYTDNLTKQRIALYRVLEALRYARTRVDDEAYEALCAAFLDRMRQEGCMRPRGRL
jgi:hypothetical protein